MKGGDFPGKRKYVAFLSRSGLARAKRNTYIQHEMIGRSVNGGVVEQAPDAVPVCMRTRNCQG